MVVTKDVEDGSPPGSSCSCKTVLLTPEERTWPFRQFSILDDVLGPDGHGPSSSHTIAPQRIALEAHKLLGGLPEEVNVTMFNSFATTGHGHRTDVAITAGLLGFQTTDPRTRLAKRHAEEVGLRPHWNAIHDSTEHPNTLELNLRRGPVTVNVKAVSIGGGNFDVIERNKTVKMAA